MEKLCLFCEHFVWRKEEMWGMGSTMTGPMFEGGDSNCRKGHREIFHYPNDESDFRRIVLFAEKCLDYKQVQINQSE